MGLGDSGELGYTVGVRMNGTNTLYGYSNSSGVMKVTAMLFILTILPTRAAT